MVNPVAASAFEAHGVTVPCKPIAARAILLQGLVRGPPDGQSAGQLWWKNTPHDF